MVANVITWHCIMDTNVKLNDLGHLANDFCYVDIKYMHCKLEKDIVVPTPRVDDPEEFSRIYIGNLSRIWEAPWRLEIR